MRKVWASIAAVAIAVAAFATSAHAETVSKTVNFRTAPKTTSSTFGYIKAGENVDVLEKLNTYWLKISYKGKVGYVSTAYVDYTTPPAPVVEAGASSILKTGEKYLGAPYKFSAKAGSGYFDCSLFVQTVFKENGISLPRNSRQQSVVGDRVSLSKLQVGDLIFFERPSGYIYHVAIYAGNNQILHTFGSGGVKYQEYTSYWKGRASHARRVL
ncbi:Gamma-D-glutamyl-L-lysine endopeptidase [compost metagenome]